MTQRVGTAARRARLKGIARSIRRYLGSLDAEKDSIWHTSKMVDADRCLIKGEHGVIERHHEKHDEPWFEVVTETSNLPENFKSEDDKKVQALKLTDAGRQANRRDAYDFAGQADTGSQGQQLATDGGEAVDNGSN